MIRTFIAVLFVTLVTSTASAQITLSTPTNAGVYIGIGTSTWSPWVGHDGSSYTSEAIMEFLLAGLPTTAMTTNNFTAKLNNLSVYQPTWSSTYFSYWGSGSMHVDLYDLADIQEDNIITVSDYGQNIGSVIQSNNYEPRCNLGPGG
jgi:hypothetical protein